MVPDATIRTRVRSVLTRYWIDLREVQIRVVRGLVRLDGRLEHHGTAVASTADHVRLDEIVAAVRRIQGVRRVVVDLEESPSAAAERSRGPTLADRVAAEQHDPREVEVLELDALAESDLSAPR